MRSSTCIFIDHGRFKEGFYVLKQMMSSSLETIPDSKPRRSFREGTIFDLFLMSAALLYFFLQT